MSAIELPEERLKEQPSVLGVSISGSKRLQFLVLSLGYTYLVRAVVCGIGFSTIQEHVFRIEGFVFGGWMSFLMYFSWIILSFIEIFIKGQIKRTIPLHRYALVSAMALIGVYFTNWSLLYINYTTRIVFKSCRVLPVMTLRMIIQRRQYTRLDFTAAFVLVCGICSFTLGDRLSYPKMDLTGFILITVALLSDAVASNLEEKWFFDIPTPCPHAEAVHFLSLFSTLYALTALLMTGELIPAVMHSRDHLLVLPCIFILSTFSFIGVEFVLLLIQHFGATTAELVKSLRRVLQVFLSFLVFPKPVTIQHGIGALMVFASLLWFEHGNRKQSSLS